jgi:DNA-binding NtrC family response regulator
VSNECSRRLSIIVAGEEDATRQELHGIVRRTLGARVREALDGWEVMSQLLMPGNVVDLVISELRVLRGSGLDALIPMRAAGIGVPFLLLGGPVRPGLHATAARLGALLLDEPVEVSDLVAGVRQLCGSGRSLGPGRRGGYTAC